MYLRDLFITAIASPSVKDLPQVKADAPTLQAILTIIFTTTGAISLLIITIAGFKYIVSRGSAQEVAKAKNAIVYAVIGLIISITAGSIVRLVIGAV